MNRFLQPLIRCGLPLAAGLLLSPACGFSQTSIAVQFTAGTTQYFTVQPSGKLYFNSGSLYIVPSSGGATTNYPLSIIRKIYFGTGPAAVASVDDENTISVVPNPVSDYFTLTGSTAQKHAVVVYSMTGQKLLSGTYAPDERIGADALASGMYILTVDNKPFKLLKK